MNSSDSINREALVRLVGLLRPALSTQDFIPALKHIAFGHGFASSYNDNLAIRIKTSKALDLDCCLPGDLLGKALGSFNAESVLVTPGADGSVQLQAGRGKVKTQSLPLDAFPLSMPKLPSKHRLELDADIINGISLCLIGVGNNPTHPATMGVTLDAEEGRAVLYSTDNATISVYKTTTKFSLPGDTPVIMPTAFCEQLISLSKAYPKADMDLHLFSGALVAELVEGDEAVAQVFTKVLDDLQAIDFRKHITKYANLDKVGTKLAEIPPNFDAAFDRALLVLGGVVDKATKITPTDSGIKLLSLSDAGEASDTLGFDGEGPDPLDIDEVFHVDPVLIARACKRCTKVAFLPRVVLFNGGARFFHIVSHCSAA